MSKTLLEVKNMHVSIHTDSGVIQAVRGVSFFINGVQPETLAGGLYLPGDFLRNGSMIRE